MKNPFNVFLFFSLLFIFSACKNDKKQDNQDTIAKTDIQKQAPIIKYGYNLDDYILTSDTIQSGDSFGSIMNTHGFSTQQVFKITHQVNDSIFNARRIIAGKPYFIVKSKKNPLKPIAFIYQNNRIDYTVINLTDTITAYRKKRPVTVEQHAISGIINASLSEAMNKAGARIALTHALARIYQWKIDFFHLKKGDKFKIIYSKKYINDSIYAGIGDIKAAEFIHDGEPYYAFYFGKDSVGLKKYYDDSAKSLQSFFLKAPVDFTRISSHYTKRRYHPILHRWMSHLGTDYAAPTGTPIHVTADGVVIASRYNKYNGNYVKVRHNSKYTTQYLHMSKRNVVVGQHVKQGDVIGFVGQTGLATGPHVCYRFWVNGKQVDPYKQDLPSSEPLADSLKDKYYKFIAPIKKKLDGMIISKPEEVANIAKTALMSN